MGMNQTRAADDGVAREFFERDPVTCARELIGCTLRVGTCSGIIVETEAYAALGDPACHTWRRPGAREFVARHQPGAAYVYLNYGLHWLFNLLVKGGESDGFVLIRALEPSGGIELMQQRRKRLKREALCNGPGKLTQALGITGRLHGSDSLCGEGWRLSHGEKKDHSILVSRRIGISQAAEYPWRFLLRGSRCVSVSA
jgi:DNA-3-methyladenine glycosylase